VKLVLVTGSRKWRDKWSMHRLLSEMAPTVLIEGGQRGADKLSKAWALKYGVHPIETEALWDYSGTTAGPLRNQFMLQVALGLRDAWGAPFPLPESVGTWHMVKICKAAGLEVRICE
jgi:YspA, cpYpsA-related SLOG family